jgi:heme A synthase
MAGDNATFEGPTANKAEDLSRLIELELIQKRLEWQKTIARRKTIRSMSILFLFLVITGTVLAFYFAFTRVNEQRAAHPPSPGASTPVQP